ncbi:MAG: hypothetical protein FE834_02745 [Gammaproteobacteria bacterium]|uniref:DUF2975 domain-containing protein n=1 Tax=hydrothermal vent metagenome TaxID=652676 RepID=A0A1W1E5G0_9ZZZZ|nr:hypothetical protein [Gammaproteobacteria bacterium]
MKIEKSSLGLWLGSFAKISAILLLVMNAVFWFHPDLARQVAESYSGVDASLFTLTVNNQILGWLISSLQLSVLSFALFTIAGIFEDFGKGLWFVARFSYKLKLFGGSLLLFSLLAPVVQALTSLALTYANPEGERMFVVSFTINLQGLIILFVGILLLLMGRVMDKAIQISDENKEII